MWHPSLVDQPVRGLCSTAGKICGCESKRSIDIGEILDRGSSIGSTGKGGPLVRRWIHSRTMSQAPSWKGKETGQR